MKMKLEKDVQIKNKRASFEFTLMDRYDCGLQLMGSEIKSIRQGKASITEAYCFVHNNEVWVKNMNISEYKEASLNNHAPKRERKLLLKKNEITKIISKLKNKGFTLIPTLLFINENGFAKLQIHIAKGKKLYDKRESLKTKDATREMARKMK
ncbi:MAG TPA: SsrA-binding protein SmpB [Bacteroidia bacterium]|nr:SsrA-binding protein SmpB [Bacteroidia bacterium]